MAKRKTKQIRMWMVVGPAGGFAPYYGINYTKKALLQKLSDQGTSLGAGTEIVRVTVSESGAR